MFQFYLGGPNLDDSYCTLIIEMTFYILMLFIFEKKWLKHSNIICIILCSATVFLTHYYHKITYINNIFMWLPLLQFLPLFFAGITFYKIYSNKNGLAYKYLIIAFCFMCQIILFPDAGRSNSFINWTEYNMMLFIYFTLFALFVNDRLTFIVNKTTLFLGKISYALYLIHQYISLKLILPIFYVNLGLNFWIVVFFIDLPIIIGLATFMTYQIEVPYSKKIKEKLRTASMYYQKQDWKALISQKTKF